jgi:hypothetical protein
VLTIVRVERGRIELGMSEQNLDAQVLGIGRMST